MATIDTSRPGGNFPIEVSEGVSANVVLQDAFEWLVGTSGGTVVVVGNVTFDETISLPSAIDLTFQNGTVTTYALPWLVAPNARNSKVRDARIVVAEADLSRIASSAVIEITASESVNPLGAALLKRRSPKVI